MEPRSDPKRGAPVAPRASVARRLLGWVVPSTNEPRRPSGGASYTSPEKSRSVRVAPRRRVRGRDPLRSSALGPSSLVVSFGRSATGEDEGAAGRETVARRTRTGEGRFVGGGEGGRSAEASSIAQVQGRLLGRRGGRRQQKVRSITSDSNPLEHVQLDGEGLARDDGEDGYARRGGAVLRLARELSRVERPYGDGGEEQRPRPQGNERERNARLHTVLHCVSVIAGVERDLPQRETGLTFVH